MHLPFRYRLSVAERSFWILLALLLMWTVRGHAQSRPTTYRYSSPSAHRNSHGLRPGATDDEGREFVRNHGTGLRLGSELASLRTARFTSALEMGGYHQRRLGEVGSVQVEALYFRQPATATALSTRGLRLPVLLVLNPWDNVSFHLGPQLRWQMASATTAETSLRTAARLTTEFVFGAEARVYRGRVGTRYGMPLGLLADLPAAGDRFGSAWRAGQLQVYLGFDVFDQ